MAGFKINIKENPDKSKSFEFTVSIKDIQIGKDMVSTVLSEMDVIKLLQDLSAGVVSTPASHLTLVKGDDQ